MLTNRPVLAVVNLGEDAAGDDTSFTKPVSDEAGGGAEVLGVSVKLEAEASQLPVADRAELAEGFGLGRGGHCPGWHSPPTGYSGDGRFSPPGTRRAGRGRSGPGPRRPSAPESSTRTCNGFMRAEVVHWDELLVLGSWSAARDVGKLRVEGKEYEAAGSDVLEIRFNV